MTDRPARPNILYVLSDQHRPDVLGCAGHPVVQTPNLDRLAADGVRFSEVWCQSPLCQPSRGSIITGRYVHEHAITTNFAANFDPSWDTMMKSLQRAGYATANIGKTHYYTPELAGLLDDDDPHSMDLRDYGEFVASFGFDHVLEEFDRYVHAVPGVTTAYTEHLAAQGLLEAYQEQIRSIWRATPHHWDGVTSVLDQGNDLTSFLADAAVDWLGGHDGSRPFFLQLAFVQPHVPLMGDPEWAAYYEDKDVPLGPRAAPSAPNEVWDEHLRALRRHSNSDLLTDDYVRRGARQYYAMVSLIDQKVGDVLAALERKGWLDDTWVIYSSDHGEMLGDHNLMAKMSFYRPSVRVPLIIRPPRASVEQSPAVGVSDEIVELIDVTATVVDAAGASTPEGSHGRSLLPILHGQPVARESVFSELRGLRNAERYYVAVSDGRARCTIERRTGTPCELFDLEADPDEVENLVDDPSAKPLLEDLRERIDAHLEQAP